MLTKVCKQCGALKPTAQYRQYYGGRKGYYTTCRLCEKINSREKYLNSKETLTPQEQEELQKIHDLWRYQAALGLQPPRASKKEAEVSEHLDSMLSTYSARAEAVKGVTQASAPAELLSWLYKELTEPPEYYQEEIYEMLLHKYRPQLFIDTETMLPVYDNEYRDVLQRILARFDEYEDIYYA